MGGVIIGQSVVNNAQRGKLLPVRLHNGTSVYKLPTGGTRRRDIRW